MNKLALTIPGFSPIPTPAGLKSEFTNLASLVSPALNIVFYVAAFVAFYYLMWGAFQYILAAGKKEDLAKARTRISWALIGLIVTFAAFIIARFASEIFPPTKGGLPF